MNFVRKTFLIALLGICWLNIEQYAEATEIGSMMVQTFKDVKNLIDVHVPNPPDVLKNLNHDLTDNLFLEKCIIVEFVMALALYKPVLLSIHAMYELNKKEIEEFTKKAVRSALYDLVEIHTQKRDISDIKSRVDQIRCFNYGPTLLALFKLALQHASKITKQSSEVECRAMFTTCRLICLVGHNTKSTAIM